MTSLILALVAGIQPREERRPFGSQTLTDWIPATRARMRDGGEVAA
jgi:hypothetical protein